MAGLKIDKLGGSIHKSSSSSSELSESSSSEEESEEEVKDGVMIAKQPKEKKEDANKVLAKAQHFKPAEGVKFVRYDQYGVPIEPDAETGFDY